MTSLDDKTRTELEAAAFRTLVAHLRKRTDVQNIDLMNLAGFCRNCLSKWYLAAAEEKGLDLDYAAARELVYGMPYEEWKAKHQSEATPEQKAAFAESHKHGRSEEHTSELQSLMRISYAVFRLKKKIQRTVQSRIFTKPH